MIQIDINCDIGEGLNNELDILPYISSCNIACGGHAGDIEIMTRVLKLAKRYSLKIGAHPSYPDKKNFGREIMNISSVDLKESIMSQILDLREIALSLGISLHHVKPHGALYNKAAYDDNTANIIIDAVTDIDDQLKIYTPYNSVIARSVHKNLKVVTEGFADRSYNKDYSLVSRKLKDAVLTNSDAVLAHVLPMLKQQKLTTISGDHLPFKIDTLCVHSDTDNASMILRNLRDEFIKEGIQVI